MKKVLIVLPSEYNKLETFLKVLVDHLMLSKTTKFYFTHNSARLDLTKIVAILKLIFNLRKVVSYYSTIENRLTILKKMKNIYVNSNSLIYRKLDVIHFSFSNLAVSNFTIGKIYNARVSVGFRGYDITYFPLNHPNCYSIEYWKNIDFIQTNSDDLYRCALRWGVSSEVPYYKITAAVNDEFILSPGKVKIKESFHNCAVKILFIGRLHWKKGIESLIRLLLISNTKEIDMHLTIIGDGQEFEKLKYLIWKYDLYKQITLLGRLNQLEILSVIDETDIVVAPSIQEGCSNVVLEAQARGKFCIVSDADGMNEVILNNETGFMFEEFNEAEILNLIIKYVNYNHQERSFIAIRTIERIRKQFLRSKQIEEWEYYFNEFIHV
jgi:colanic acid/amylovoran biosynthesis glycosyltransferase